MSLVEILKCDLSNEPTEQHFPVMLLTMLHKAVLTSKFVHEILLFDHLNES